MRKHILLIMLLFVLISTVQTQILHVDSVKRIVIPGSNEIFPVWSEGGDSILFQSNKNGNWDIFIFDLEKDTLIAVTSTPFDEQHPVFIPPGFTSVVFDQVKDKEIKLYKINLKTKGYGQLFKRDINASQASFSPSGRLVTFKGYDKNSESYQVFTYDFIYDNLNRLTDYKRKIIYSPKFSPDGKTILFGIKSQIFPYDESLIETSWYGKKKYILDSISAGNFCWSYNGFRIISLQKDTGNINKMITERKDGSYKHVLIADKYQKYSPAVNYNGTRLAVAIKYDKDFDIVIFDIDR